MSEQPKEYDAFISYATEDYDAIVRPLKELLRNQPYYLNIWCYKSSIELGSPIPGAIHYGLHNSNFGIIVVSKDYINAYEDPERTLLEREFNVLITRKNLIQIWHGVTRDDVIRIQEMLGPIDAEITDYKAPDVPTIARRVAERITGKHFPEEPEYDDKYNERQLIRDSGGVGEKVIPILIDILERGTVDEKQSAIIALGNIRDTKAVELLIKALEDTDTRRSAINALGINGDTRAIKPLIDQIDKIRINSIHDIYSKGYDYSVLITITDALIRIGEPAVELLIAALEDRYWLVRWVAVSSLWKIGDSRAKEPLIKVLSDEHIDVRGQATYVLGEIGDERALDPLTERLSDSNVDVRRFAKEALDAITSRRRRDVVVNKEALRSALYDELITVAGK